MMRLGVFLWFVLGLVHAQREPTTTTTKPTTTTSAPTFQGSYWLTFSDKIRPGYPLNYAVQILKGSQPVRVTLSVLNGFGNVTLLSGSNTVTPGPSQYFQLQIPMDIKAPYPENNNPWGQYREYLIHVVGEGSEVNFKAKGHAYYERKSFTTFIQTDKAMYKPGQTVKVRCLAMQADLKTIRGEPWTIQVKDPNGDLIWQELGLINAETGVAEFQIPLADRIPTGQWSIITTLLGISETKSFKVDNYVLPKFEVQAMTTRAYGLVRDKSMDVTVKATYTFGQPVASANYVLTISPRDYYCKNEYYYCTQEYLDKVGEPSSKFIVDSGVLDKNGEAVFKVSTDDLLEMDRSLQRWDVQSLSWRTFEVQAKVTEPDTLRTAEAEMEYRFYEVPVSVQTLGITPSVFKPGLAWTGYFEVNQPDSSKLSKEDAARLTMTFNVTYGITTIVERELKPEEETDDGEENPPRKPPNDSGSSSGSDSDTDRAPELAGDMAIGLPYPGYQQRVTKYHVLELPQKEYAISEEGWVVLTFDNIPPKANVVQIKGSVKGFEKFATVHYSIYSAMSRSDNFLQIQVPPKRLKVEDTLTVKTKATEPVNQLTCQLFAKGIMIESNTITQDPPSAESTFDIELTQIMTPVVRLVVFYVRGENKEFIVDAVTLNVDKLFPKPVSLEFDPAVVKPGDDVTLKIKQDVGNEPAIAYLLSNDKSVLLLKTGNDLSENLVREALMSYDYGNFFPWMRYMFICGWPSFFGGRDASSVFNDAGVRVLTDGDVYEYADDSWRFPTIGGDGSGIVTDAAGADNSADKNEGSAESITTIIRKFFPENWLWESVIIPAGSTEVSIARTAPDTITSWVTNAFTIHPVYGLTVATNTANLTTTQQLSVQLDLPNSVTRYEQFCFTAIVFNQGDKLKVITLVLEPGSGFNSLYLNYNENDQSDVTVSATSGRYTYVWGKLDKQERASRMFCFVANEIGEMPIVVKVQSEEPVLTDGVERTITVKAEGIPRSQSLSYLVSVGETVVADMGFLSDYVKGSQFISVNVVGNLLGSILDGIDSLLRKPYGCGEQNMLNFAPNVFLLDFFDRTDTMTDERLAKGRNFMLIGYQKARLYEHGTSGGYSTFGSNNDTKENPSLWLTDFILKCFSQAEQLNKEDRHILSIDMDVLGRSVLYILSQQQEGGYFVETGKVFNKDMQGGFASASAKGVALTSYSAIALYEAWEVFKQKLEDPNITDDLRAKYDTMRVLIQDALEAADTFLKNQLDSLEDPYDICITAYALNLIDSPVADQAFQKMVAAAKRDGGNIFWAREKDPSIPVYPWSNTGQSIDVESTAYALLTYLVRGESDYLPIVNYLAEQRGPDGGFYSTQDTVVGLQALTALPDDFFEEDNLPYRVKVSYMDGNEREQFKEFTIEEDSLQVVRQLAIPYESVKNAPSTIKIEVSSESSNQVGKVYVEVILDYNVLETSLVPFFDTRYQVDMQKKGFHLTIDIKTTGEPASMTLLEVDIPAGYYPEIEDLLAIGHVSFAEVKNDRVIVYFNTDVIGTTYVKTTIIMNNDGGALTRPMPKFYYVRLFYNPDTEVSVEYLLESADFCDVAKEFGACPFLV